MFLTRAVRILVPAAVLAYAGFGVASGGWFSALAAAVVAWLLWRRHPRARFAAYVLLTAVVARAAITQAWWLAGAALMVIAALQTRAAAAAWPRLRPGLRRPPDDGAEPSDRMSRP